MDFSRVIRSLAVGRLPRHRRGPRSRRTASRVEGVGESQERRASPVTYGTLPGGGEVIGAASWQAGRVGWTKAFEVAGATGRRTLCTWSFEAIQGRVLRSFSI